MDNVIIWGSSARGPHAVRTHGVVLTFADNPTDIDVFVGQDLVRVRFEFLSDASGARGVYSTDPGIPGDSNRPAMISLRFYNLAHGNTVSDGPIRFATVGSVGLWLVYEVSAVAGNHFVKKIYYTLWDGTVGDTTSFVTSSSTTLGSTRG
jgi:hypothetical protein